MALNNSTHTILIIRRINRSHEENERNFTDRKRDGIPCVVMFPCMEEPADEFLSENKLLSIFQNIAKTVILIVSTGSLCFSLLWRMNSRKSCSCYCTQGCYLSTEVSILFWYMHCFWSLNGTLMQIWKSADIFVLMWKQYIEDFT